MLSDLELGMGHVKSRRIVVKELSYSTNNIMPFSVDFIHIADQMMKSGELDILLNMIRGAETREQHEYIRLFGESFLIWSEHKLLITVVCTEQSRPKKQCSNEGHFLPFCRTRSFCTKIGRVFCRRQIFCQRPKLLPKAEASANCRSFCKLPKICGANYLRKKCSVQKTPKKYCLWI